jgi:methyl-accepting chemotaxis protein
MKISFIKYINNLSIKQKILYSFFCIVFIIILFSSFLFYQTVQYGKVIARNTDAVEALQAIENYRYKILGSHNTVVGLINSGDIKFIDDYKVSLQEVVKSYNALIKEVSDTNVSSQRQQLAEIQKTFQVWQQSMAAKQLIYMQDPYKVDLARFMEASEENKRLWQAIDQKIDTLFTAYRQLQDHYSQEQLTMLRLLQIVSAVAGIIMTALAISLAWFLSRVVVDPLRALTTITQKLKDKKWDVIIATADRGDEIGEMSKALEVFRQNGIKNEELEKQQRLDNEQKLKRAQDVQRAVQKFNAISRDLLENLKQASEEMENSSGSLKETSAQSYDFTHNLSEAASATGSSIQGVASAVEELSISVKEINEQVQKVDALSKRTVTATHEAAQKVVGLKDAAQKINSVIDFIDKIAAQVNLLALNATIESARAGEAGKGFAVVANQIKQLASQTGSATEEIATVIGTMQSEVSDVVETINIIASSVDAVSQNTESVAAVIEEQSAATNEISGNVNRVSQETEKVVKNVGGVQKKVEETKQVSDEVKQLSDNLKMCTKELRTSIQDFIHEVVIDEKQA